MTRNRALDMKEPVFSKLVLPWPTRQNPCVPEYRIAAQNNLSEAGLIAAGDGLGHRRFEGIVVLDGYVYPYATLDRLIAAGSFSQWLFFLDDQYDDAPELGRDPLRARHVLTRAYGLLCGQRDLHDHSSFARFTGQLRSHLTTLAPPGWMERFLKHVSDYLFHGSLAAIEHWAQHRTPSTAEYTSLRMHDSAVFPAVDMIEVAAGIELPEAVHRHPAVMELVELTVKHTAFVNDLFSYQKEVLVSGTPFNLVNVLMQNELLSFEAAVWRVIHIANAAVTRFIEVEKTLPRWNLSVARSVDMYIHGMKSWMRGNVDFSLASQRYRAPDSPFVELRGAAATSGSSPAA